MSRPRWESPASSGMPVADRSPETTHELEPQSISCRGLSSSYTAASAEKGGAVTPDTALGGVVTSAPSG